MLLALSKSVMGRVIIAMTFIAREQVRLYYGPMSQATISK